MHTLEVFLRIKWVNSGEIKLTCLVLDVPKC